jgi:cell division septum initiation protein DivIVA
VHVQAAPGDVERLGDRVEQLEKELAELQGRERLLSSTLVSAEKVAAEAKDAAKREAELIVAEAHHEARSITRTALTERERLFAEARRIETLLRAALGMMDEARLDGTEAAAAAPPEPDAWPRREDTREFEFVPLVAQESPPPPPAAAESEGEEGEAEAPDRSSSDKSEDEARPPRDFAWG